MNLTQAPSYSPFFGNVNISSNNGERQPSLDFSIFARLCHHASGKTNNSNSSFLLQLRNICNSPLYSITIDRKNILPAPLPKASLEVFMALYILIIILAVLGNSLVLGLIGVVKKARALTDIYIISLASSDLMIATLNMPFQLYHIVANDWMATGNFGSFLCKFTAYIEGVTVVASILTLLFIAIDRYTSFSSICKIRMRINLIFEFTNIKVFSYSVFEPCRPPYTHNI